MALEHHPPILQMTKMMKMNEMMKVIEMMKTRSEEARHGLSGLRTFHRSDQHRVVGFFRDAVGAGFDQYAKEARTEL